MLKHSLTQGNRQKEERLFETSSNKEFKQSCRHTQKESNEFLFGDSHGDNVKSIGDSLKLTNLVSYSTYRSAFTTSHGDSKSAQGRMFPPTFN